MTSLATSSRLRIELKDGGGWMPFQITICDLVTVLSLPSLFHAQLSQLLNLENRVELCDRSKLLCNRNFGKKIHVTTSTKCPRTRKAALLCQFVYMARRVFHNLYGTPTTNWPHCTDVAKRIQKAHQLMGWPQIAPIAYLYFAHNSKNNTRKSLNYGLALL